MGKKGELPEMSVLCEAQAMWNDHTHRESGIRVSEEAILEVGPPASAAPADAWWSRDK